MVSKKTCRDLVVLVHHVEKRIRVLRVSSAAMHHDAQTRGVNNHFVDLAHPAYELQGARTQVHVHIVHIPLDLNGDHILAVVDALKRRVHKGFVQVQDKCLLAPVLFTLLPQEGTCRDLDLSLRLSVSGRADG